MSPEEKTAYAREQILKTAQAASDLEVPVVTGLIGSHVWDKWYVFPSANEKLYEEGVAVFAERWNPILDEFRKYGVKWALEVHPTGIAYTIETAQMALAALDNRSELGFNFDPSHLVWQLIDPVVFIKTFKDDPALPREGRGVAGGRGQKVRGDSDGSVDEVGPGLPVPGARLGPGKLAPRHHCARFGRLRLRLVL